MLRLHGLLRRHAASVDELLIDERGRPLLSGRWEFIVRDPPPFTVAHLTHSVPWVIKKNTMFAQALLNVCFQHKRMQRYLAWKLARECSSSTLPPGGASSLRRASQVLLDDDRERTWWTRLDDAWPILRRRSGRDAASDADLFASLSPEMAEFVLTCFTFPLASNTSNGVCARPLIPDAVIVDGEWSPYLMWIRHWTAFFATDPSWQFVWQTRLPSLVRDVHAGMNSKLLLVLLHFAMFFSPSVHVNQCQQLRSHFHAILERVLADAHFSHVAVHRGARRLAAVVCREVRLFSPLFFSNSEFFQDWEALQVSRSASASLSRQNSTPLTADGLPRAASVSPLSQRSFYHFNFCC